MTAVNACDSGDYQLQWTRFNLEKTFVMSECLWDGIRIGIPCRLVNSYLGYFKSKAIQRCPFSMNYTCWKDGKLISSLTLQRRWCYKLKTLRMKAWDAAASLFPDWTWVLWPSRAFPCCSLSLKSCSPSKYLSFKIDACLYTCMHLKGRERAGDTQRTIFWLLIHSVNGCRSHGWAGWSQVTGSLFWSLMWVVDWGAGIQATLCCLCRWSENQPFKEFSRTTYQI